jgi:PAS domain S-box-containing protein
MTKLDDPDEAGQQRRTLDRDIQLSDCIPVASLILSLDGTILQANPLCASLLEVDYASLPGINFLSFLAESERPSLSAFLNQGAAPAATNATPPASFTIEVKLQQPEGRTLRVQAVYFKDRRTCHAALIDITEHKRIEARLSSIIDGTHAGTWEWNVQTGEMLYNERWAEILGYTLAELAPLSGHIWHDLVHPEDMPASDEEVARLFTRESPLYDLEYRMKHHSGEWVWIQDRGKVIEWTPDGRPLRLAGIHTDITARKQAEEALRQRVDELSALQATVLDLSVQQDLFSLLNSIVERILEAAQRFQRVYLPVRSENRAPGTGCGTRFRHASGSAFACGRRHGRQGGPDAAALDPG